MRPLLLLALASCSVFKKPPPVVDPPDGTPVVAQIDRGACFGPCPVYSVVVYGDGTVIYAGESNVKVKERRSRKLSKEDLGKVTAAFEKHGFAGMDASYEKSAEDDPATISVTFRGKTVIRAAGDPRTPADLVAIEDEVETLLKTSEWTGIETKKGEEQRKSSRF